MFWPSGLITKLPWQQRHHPDRVQKRSEEAVAVFQKLLSVKPDYDWGEGLLAYERLHACDWTDFDVAAQKMVEGHQGGSQDLQVSAFDGISDDARRARSARSCLPHVSCTRSRCGRASATVQEDQAGLCVARLA